MECILGDYLVTTVWDIDYPCLAVWEEEPTLIHIIRNYSAFPGMASHLVIPALILTKEGFTLTKEGKPGVYIKVVVGRLQESLARENYILILGIAGL